MLSEVVGATNALEGLATHLSTFWTDAPFQQANGGWNTPPLTRNDLVERVRAVSQRLKSLDDSQISNDLKQKIVRLPDQINWFQGTTLPQMPSNVEQVISILEIILKNIESSIPPDVFPDWAKVAKSDLIPRDLAKRLRAIESALKTLEPRAGNLKEKIDLIESAHSAALDLPTDLDGLNEARKDAESQASRLREISESAEAFLVATETTTAQLLERDAEAQRVLANIDQAYSAATSVGLAAAFSERAAQLRRSTWLWVVLLVATLVVGGYLGHLRLESLQVLTSHTPVQAGWVWLNAGMSLLSVAAPIWFAWISTRQISQRFRLAEDYGFKASVARAYEGYRKEAARIDPEFEARLFASALDRLDEPPLRFVSNEEHGSPYEALLASKGFQKALETLPSFRDGILALVGKFMNAPKAVEAAEAPATAAPTVTTP